MVPILWKIGPIEIPAFGVCLAIGVLIAWFYFMKQFPHKDADLLSRLLTASLIAGLIGARVNYMLEHLDEIESWKDTLSMLFSRSGLTVYGGMIAGIAIAFYYTKKHRLPTLRIMDAGAPALCIGYFFGRLGCQLAGDGDYGTPSNLPWAMAYPHGTVPTLLRVHPTPIYEMLAYASILFILIYLKRQNVTEGRVFSMFLVLTGLERFAVEFIRLNPILFWHLTEAQMVSVVFFAAGVFLNCKSHRGHRDHSAAYGRNQMQNAEG